MKRILTLIVETNKLNLPLQYPNRNKENHNKDKENYKRLRVIQAMKNRILASIAMYQKLYFKRIIIHKVKI